ncbi:MAG: DEAD/DEAH box helicase family protein [Acidithiobacillus sp.]|nr:DEAD/DEAH box helicase family protein [Acidithiobacillus sp.]
MENIAKVNMTTPIKGRAEHEATGSARQSAALTRWNVAQPATAEQIAAIAGCDEDLAKRIAKSRHAPRLDAKTRHGKAVLLFPYSSRSTGGRSTQTAIEFHTKDQHHGDVMGAREVKITTRNQEAATGAIRADPAQKIGKIQGVQVITAGHLAALAVHEAIPGADILIAASPRIPYHQIRSWQDAGKKQIWIEGFSSAEITAIVTRLQDAGWYGTVRGNVALTTADRMVVADGDGEPEVTEHGDPAQDESAAGISETEVTDIGELEITETDTVKTKPDLAPVDLQVIRTSAWDILVAMGADALRQHLRDAKLIFTPKGMRVGGQEKDGDQEQEQEQEQDGDGDGDGDTTGKPSKPPRPKSSRPAGAPSAAARLLRSWRQTGKNRTDRDLYFHDMDAATEYLNQCLDDGKEHHVNGVEAVTGLGKTYAIQVLMFKANTPHIIVAPTNALSQEIHEGLKAMRAKGIGANKDIALHQPRCADNCARFDLVKTLQEASRGPYAQACMMADLENSVPGDCPHAETCQYLQQLKRTAEADIVVATHASAGSDSSLLKQRIPGWNDDDGDTSIPRKLVIDENTPAFSRINLSPEDVRQSILALSCYLDESWMRRRSQGALGDKFTEEKFREAREIYEKFSFVLNALYVNIANWADPRKSQNMRRLFASGAWADFLEIYPKLPEFLTLMDGSTLAERPVLKGDPDKWIIPNQWLSALYQALKDDMVWIYKGQLIIGKEGGLWKNFLKHGGYFMDATMSLAHRRIIQNFRSKGGADGKVHTVAMHQPHLHILQILDDAQHGKAALMSHGVVNEVRRLLREWTRLIHGDRGFQGYGHGAVAGVIHKFLHDILVMAFLGDQDDETLEMNKGKISAALERRKLTPGSEAWNDAMRVLGIPLDPAQAREQWNLTIDDVMMLGHWGKDDRGHNRWKDALCLLGWGAPLEPPEEYEINYSIYRVIMKRHGVELEAWDGSVVTGPQEIEANGGETLLTTHFPMPTVPDARAFVLDQVNAQIAQAIGRLRGVRRTAENPADVLLFMGDYPVAANDHDHMLPTVKYRTSLGSALAQRATKEMAVVKEAATTREEELGVAAITDALNEKYAFTTDNRVGLRVVRKHFLAIRARANARRISFQEAARQLVDEIARFIITDPGAFPGAGQHTWDRLCDRAHWNRMWIGTGPWADATLELLAEIADIYLDQQYQATG